jgi:Ca2+-transporting ATPase
VPETITQALEAGVRTVMVTGDHPATAAAIAKAVGIPAERVITGDELDGLDEPALQRALQKVAVFARATPEHKYRIVQALQHDGEIVAVTGDGINDALALKAADVGVAMGESCTDVAREAAAIVLADDNYFTLARGLFEGRKFYDNLKKGVTYYLAVKLGLILIFLLPVLLGLPMPFAPIQIIVLEMFMDLAASAGFVAEPAERAIYARRPQRRGAVALLDGAALRAVALKGGLLFAAVMAGYAFAWLRGADAAHLQTAAFVAWMVGHIALAFVSRSDTQPVFAPGLFGNRVMNLWALAAVAFLLAAMYVPGLEERFRMSPLPLLELAAIAALAVAITGLAEVGKRRIGKGPMAVNRP